MKLSHLLERHFQPVLQTWDARDSALYALSLGIGSDPLDADELPYVFEGHGLRTVPSFCVTLGWPAFWQDDPAPSGVPPFVVRLLLLLNLQRSVQPRIQHRRKLRAARKNMPLHLH